MLARKLLRRMEKTRHATDARTANTGQRGVSLLEVMIAVLVLAVGILGAASLQLNAIRYSASAGYSTQAALTAGDMLERMRANPSALPHYAAASVTGVCAANAGGASITAQDMADFARSVTCELPAAAASIAVAGGRATVSISWSEARTVANEGNTVFVVSSVVR